MKNKLFLSVSPVLLLVLQCLPFFGQVQGSTIEVFKDTLFIPKQAVFNEINSRKTLQFELPENTVKWLYYYESIDKLKIKEALARNYYSPADFVTDTSKKTDGGLGYMTLRKMGPVMLEVLLMDQEGEEQFLRSKNNLYVFTRPQSYIRTGSALCETGDCNSSGKIIIDSKSQGKYILGFRNIEYREDAYIVIQIVASVK